MSKLRSGDGKKEDEQMTRVLDFIVFGVARTGTTALAKLLSATDEIHCGHEVFNVWDNHADLSIPDAFHRAAETPSPALGGRVRKTSLESSKTIWERKNSLRIYGNKYPIYFLRLDEVLNEIKSRTAIMTYRDIRKVGESFNARAMNTDDRWPPGRTGVFAAGDFMLLVDQLTNIEGANILIVPQTLLLAAPKAALIGCGRFLAPDLDLTVNEMDFTATVETGQRRRSRKRQALGEADEAAIAMTEATDADRVFQRNTTFELSSIGDALQMLRRQLPADPEDYVSDLVSTRGTEAMKTFLAAWIGRNRRARL